VEAILDDGANRELDVVLVDDGGGDGATDLLRELARDRRVRAIEGPRRGAAAAINAGIRAARYAIVCQVDQDVIVHRGWMDTLVRALDDPSVGAAQGRYCVDRSAKVCARVMGLDLEQRYAALHRTTDHVCTGNTAYLVAALHAAGLFDEDLGYGYDNDVSYRLQEAGYRLVFCRDACSTHMWRDTFAGYVVQQYGFGYGRLDVVAKHRRRVTGDRVSPCVMMLHPAVLAVALAAASVSLSLAAIGASWRGAAAVAIVLIATLVGERLVAGVRAAVRFRDAYALLFPILHLVRDATWVAAIMAWSVRRLTCRPPDPSHSMRPRRPSRDAGSTPSSAAESLPPLRIACIVPAHNEAENLPAVVAELRCCHPDLDVIVVDDGSTDGSVAVLGDLDVRWLHLRERLGVGGAMRAGLRYAWRAGYDTVVRIDGDGQHPVDAIAQLLAPIRQDVADVVYGSRYFAPGGEQRSAHHGPRRAAQRALAACLSIMTRQRVTDPTSGFCALGPRAIQMLSELHPPGYPEAELLLLLRRNRLRVAEVPVESRRRLSGRSSLTGPRLVAAAARVLLAVLIVPLRAAARVGR
jgi:glycosyltransferase involved in cell wall biosynthesis